MSLGSPTRELNHPILHLPHNWMLAISTSCVVRPSQLKLMVLLLRGSVSRVALKVEVLWEPLTRLSLDYSTQRASVLPHLPCPLVSYNLFVCSTSLDSDAEKTDAIIGLKEALSQDSSVLLQEHEAAWAQLWSSGIEVSSEKSLPQIINSTLYFLLSSARSDYPWSYSPGSLSSNSYNGFARKAATSPSSKN